MQKWCPEPFTGDLDRVPGTATRLPSFEAESSCNTPSCTTRIVEDPRFEKDFDLTGHPSLWDTLDQAEKENLLEDARGLLQGEFETREVELREKHQEELAEVRTEFKEMFVHWSREFSAGLVKERRELAVLAGRLAVALARKIIRSTVDVDQGFLIRTLETSLFKVRNAQGVTVILNPDDADLLNGDPDLMSRLHIEAVVPDRRMEKGGCRIRQGLREWDASLSGQMDALVEIVEETLAAGEGPTSPNLGDQDDSRLD